ncbi:hypothetical protein Hanom_Chr16g01518641 [Helianthus anomalus]
MEKTLTRLNQMWRCWLGGERGGGEEKMLGLSIYVLKRGERRGEKRFEDLSPHLPQEEVVQTFYNEITSKKQTHCRFKRLRVVCVGQT